jgi:predicted nicotinamide N-methyase
VKAEQRLQDPQAIQALIRSVTEVASVRLVPELRLHLLMPSHALWRATPAEASAQGLVLPYWAFAWPGGQALARWVLDHPQAVLGKRVLDVGSGGAIEGLAALKAGAAHLTCADVDVMATLCASLNAAENAVCCEALTTDVLESPAGAFHCDVVLVGDLTFDEAITARLVPWLLAHHALGRTVLVGDAGRVRLPEAFVELATYQAPFDGNPQGSTDWLVSVRTLGQAGPSSRPSIPEESRVLAVNNLARRSIATAAMATSNARRRGLPMARKSSAAVSAADSSKGTTPSARELRETASCSGLRGPRQNSYQARALISISHAESETVRSVSRSSPGPLSALTRKSVSRW